MAKANVTITIDPYVLDALRAKKEKISTIIEDYLRVYLEVEELDGSQELNHITYLIGKKEAELAKLKIKKNELEEIQKEELDKQRKHQLEREEKIKSGKIKVIEIE